MKDCWVKCKEIWINVNMVSSVSPSGDGFMVNYDDRYVKMTPKEVAPLIRCIQYNRFRG